MFVKGFSSPFGKTWTACGEDCTVVTKKVTGDHLIQLHHQVMLTTKEQAFFAVF